MTLAPLSAASVVIDEDKLDELCDRLSADCIDITVAGEAFEGDTVGERLARGLRDLVDAGALSLEGHLLAGLTLNAYAVSPCDFVVSIVPRLEVDGSHRRWGAAQVATLSIEAKHLAELDVYGFALALIDTLPDAVGLAASVAAASN